MSARRLATLAVVLGLVPVARAAGQDPAPPDPGAGDVVVAFSAAQERQDGPAACGLLSDAFFERVATASRATVAEVRATCPEEIVPEVAEFRAGLAGRRVVATTTTATGVEVVVEREVFGLTTRARSRAVSENGVWKVDVPPGQERAGNELLYRVPSGSMDPTIPVGSYVAVDQRGLRSRGPRRGELVLVSVPEYPVDGRSCRRRPAARQACAAPRPRGGPAKVIKRVVGLPGDRLAFRRCRLYRNGRRLREPWVRPPGDGASSCDKPVPLTVAPRRYYFVSDNRFSAYDSRDFGPLPRSAVEGPARLVFASRG